MEQPVVSATTSVLKYDMSSGKWAELGSQAGPCNITILKSPTNEYRFVGWKESNQEVVLNLFLFPSMNYTESTPTFHQWFDEAKNAYGLNFLDANEAKKFGIAVISAIEILNGPKINKPGGDIPVPKKSVEKSPGYRTTNRKYSVDRQLPSNPTVSPYATSKIGQTNDSSTAKTPVVMSGKPQASSGAPPPPGPPPAAPPPPGPPPSGPPPPGLAPAAPSLPSVKKPAGNDLASQLKQALLKPASTNPNVDNVSRGSPTPPAQTTQPASSKPQQMDFLSELKLKNQMRTEGVNQIKKTESPRASSTPTVNVPKQNLSSKLSSSNSDLTTTSFITSSDLEKFRAELLQDIVGNMEKFKEDIINGIISRLK